MTLIETFQYGDAKVRTVLINDDEPGFVLSDLCRVLAISNGRDVAGRLADDQKGVAQIDTPGGPQQMTIVNESGMYEVVIRSDKAEAVAFRRWITGEVLPTLRRLGSYSVAQSQPAIMPTHSEALRGWAEQLERAEAAEARAAVLEQPAAAWNELAEAAGDYSVADAAKVLSRDPNISIGRDRLFEFMCGAGWIFRGNGRRWRVYQKQVDNGRLVEKVNRPWIDSAGETVIPDPTVRVTPKGLEALHKRLGGSGQLALMEAVS